MKVEVVVVEHGRVSTRSVSNFSDLQCVVTLYNFPRISRQFQVTGKVSATFVFGCVKVWFQRNLVVTLSKRFTQIYQWDC